MSEPRQDLSGQIDVLTRLTRAALAETERLLKQSQDLLRREDRAPTRRPARKAPAKRTPSAV